MSKRRIDELSNGESHISDADNESASAQTAEIAQQMVHYEDDADQPTSEPRQKKSTVANLSAQDIQIARETAELFKSNIFKLQIDELVKNLKIKDSHIKVIEKVLHRLHHIIQQVPEVENLTLKDVESYFHVSSNKVAVPFPDPKPFHPNYKFSFLQPSDVSLIGSFGLKTAIRQPEGSVIDMSITMPSKLFHSKDYVNYRAFHKRAFYIGYLADQLVTLSQEHYLPIKISYEYVNGDKLCPAIRVESITPDQPNPEHLVFEKTKFSIRIIVGFELGLFEGKKLLPDKNCIKVQSPTDQGSKMYGDHDSIQLTPTPLYNSSLLSSTTYSHYLKLLYTAKKTTESFRDACVLGKLWLRQRGFSSHFNEGGFGHFEFAILMTALLQGGGLTSNKILLHGFSSYQLFKGTIKYLATQDLMDEGYLSFTSAIGETSSKYKPDGFHVPTIFDKNTKINILWKTTKWSYETLRRHAQQTLVALNDLVYDRFDSVFLQQCRTPSLTYDLTIKIPLAELDHEKNFGPLEKISFISFENFIKSKIYAILKRGLMDRVTDISIWIENLITTFSIHKRKAGGPSEGRNIVIGLLLNPLECERLVTKGPDNEDEVNGAKFRQFWQSKASLRRFKDGTIQNCCIWASSSSEPVVLSIIKFLFDLHLSSNTETSISSHLVSNISEFQSYVPLPSLPASTKQSIISTAAFQNLNNSFDELCKILYSLELPLRIKSVNPASPSLRATSLLQPVPFAVSNPDFFNEVIVQFESSTKWPDELISLEKTKSSFLIRTLEVLQGETNYQGFITKDESVPLNYAVTLLNILTPQGYGFRIRVLTEHDEILYLRAIENADHRQRPILRDTYLRFTQKYIGSMKHHRTMNTLAFHFPFFSPTVRLFKRWMDSQLLSVHFPQEFVELLAIKVFVDPAPYSVPSSVESGFLRILQFLSQWNWKEEPLILDLSKPVDDSSLNPTTENGTSYIDKLKDNLDVQTYQLINTNFDKQRKTDPTAMKMQFFVGSKDDNSGILWTNDISLPVATRLTSLAKVATNLVMKGELNHKSIKLLFTPALADYDFVIKVQTEDLVSSSGIAEAKVFANVVNGRTSYPDDITSKMDPIQWYVDELNDKFKGQIIFSTKRFTSLNKKGSNVVTGLFNPSTVAKRKFKVSSAYNCKPVEETEHVTFNKESALNEIVALGGDLVVEVVLK
ncbi:Small subunit (SSU) processome component [Komagataella phaffii CBS 7435]|uniref:U3 small nucleolar RNA-associated protein 22 n=2 Tax=Komagataella phaffii TaxID=460519 RepID=C4R925_KOMPG|nr:putative U3 snoRNP protein involved in maturation of pre-18S rRNA [Komagataella phaffii GS115]AOA64600.1 GQ67_05223T0 [Komagataella phaffii]CAH2450490.1 Small subunit (SSU) processome component [Komagataella phaffii CBS 7435]AOA69688.1 GQ68_05205T0 [Komagataella phaffii GS115]CAY72100.1 Possible U3 snoRNP protein involved in maturation of pre-18S rRNA [Komagataella phaffii GS115]CCA40296.1 Small subunit (SSU) processome component [Komagataella phaffii CBS 7435]